ncbi:MAG: methionyl-tRNA formyltransferase [Gammaproteobacteria bacterium]|nr:methionyl-tRNA formyltransferase [Gammaproteobacteria bacterium]
MYSIVFAGTPDFAVPTLEALLRSPHRVVAVYTQPDRPAGRGRHITPSPVKRVALQHGLPVEQPLTLKEPAAVERLASFGADLMVVVAYGLLLPQSVLDTPRLGCINVHASLLPRWRGAAPIQRAILAGDAETGVTIMQMDAGLDTGPMLLKRALPIGPRDTSATLHDRLAELGAQALVEALNTLPSLTPQPQPEEGATYAQKVRKEEARIDWSLDAWAIDRQVRAFNPWPVAETTWQGQQLRVWEAFPNDAVHDRAPGTVVRCAPEGIDVATGHGTLTLTRVQLAGRNAVSAAQFLNAHRLEGAVLGT